jgi:hypothetical protein
MKKKRTRVASARELKAMKRSGQARDRALVAKGGAVEEIFLIRPKDARQAKLNWLDVDLD